MLKRQALSTSQFGHKIQDCILSSSLGLLAHKLGHHSFEHVGTPAPSPLLLLNPQKFTEQYSFPCCDLSWANITSLLGFFQLFDPLVPRQYPIRRGTEYRSSPQDNDDSQYACCSRNEEILICIIVSEYKYAC